MKKILIPTDFSELGEFAYTVAQYLAEKTDAKIDVISIISGPQGAYYSGNGLLLNDDGNDYSEWYQRLEQNTAKMAEWTSDKKYIGNVSCSIGEVDKDIIRYAENNDIDLIVMGTDGLFNKKLWGKGSHTEYVANNTSIPVLSLKCDRSDLDLEEILFVSDFLHAETINLDIIKSIQKAFDSTIVLLRVVTTETNREEDQIKEDIEAFAKANGLKKYEICLYKDGSVEAGIGKFSAERDIDLIALGNHQGKGFSKLFKRSISDDVVNHLFHPILTFPIQ